jgi:hypothetical protein
VCLCAAEENEKRKAFSRLSLIKKRENERGWLYSVETRVMSWFVGGTWRR